MQTSSPIIEQGILSTARQVPSPNKNLRPKGEVSGLVIHNISLPPAQFGGGHVEELFTNQLDGEGHPYFASIQELKVSSHLFITREGEVIQFVPFDERAWHAGRSSFAGREEWNDFAIGIELEGTDHIPYTDAQYEVLASVSRALLAYYPEILAESIVGHNDIAPGRKTDPGPAFDWTRYRHLLTL